MDTEKPSFWVMLVGMALLVVSIGLFYAAVWMDGDTASKLAATAGITMIPGFIIAIIGFVKYFDL